MTEAHKQPLLLFSLTAFFWTSFDALMTYITPLLLQRQNVSMTMIGLLIGTSSVTGALFDFVMTKLFRKTNFRRILLCMFVLCFLYPLLLWNATSIWVFLFTMAVWAIYCDLYGFGLFNFVEKFIPKKEYASSFAVVQVFRTLARIIVPLIIGFLVADALGVAVFRLSFIFLFLGFGVFLVLALTTRKQKEDKVELAQPSVALRKKGEFFLWKRVGRVLLPALFTTFFLFVIEAFFWTLAPLYGESLSRPELGGIFLTAYLVPSLFVTGIIKYCTAKFGKKRTAFVSLLFGSLCLSTLVFLHHPYAVIVVTLVAACFFALSLPAVNGIFSDNIGEAQSVEVEIEGLADSAYNIGYIVGPILAGILADSFSVTAAFSLLGIIGILAALALLLFTPKNIAVSVKKLSL